MSYGKTLNKIELAECVGQVLHKAAASAVELGNFPLGACDVQCAFECWQADRLSATRRAGVHLSDAQHWEECAEVRAAIAQLGWEF
jgi:hypothetical protein